MSSVTSTSRDSSRQKSLGDGPSGLAEICNIDTIMKFIKRIFTIRFILGINNRLLSIIYMNDFYSLERIPAFSQFETNNHSSDQVSLNY